MKTKQLHNAFKTNLKICASNRETKIFEALLIKCIEQNLIVISM